MAFPQKSAQDVTGRIRGLSLFRDLLCPFPAEASSDPVSSGSPFKLPRLFLFHYRQSSYVEHRLQFPSTFAPAAVVFDRTGTEMLLPTDDFMAMAERRATGAINKRDRAVDLLSSCHQQE